MIEPSNGNFAMNPGAASAAPDQFLSERLPVGWPWRLLVFSIALFGFSVLVYFGIMFGYAAYLEARIAGVDEDLAALTGEITPEEQERFVDFYSQIANLKTVLGRHPYGANALVFLERYTIPEVRYTEAELNVSDRALTVKGAAPSIELAGQQLAAFESAPETAEALLRDMSVEGGVSFSATVFFKDDFFSRPAL